eukprot:scaffold324804_cov66-Tisochrysis_lutea.AAC.1
MQLGLPGFLDFMMLLSAYGDDLKENLPGAQMPAGLAMPCSQHSGLHIMHVMPGRAVGCTPC